MRGEVAVRGGCGVIYGEVLQAGEDEVLAHLAHSRAQAAQQHAGAAQALLRVYAPQSDLAVVERRLVARERRRGHGGESDRVRAQRHPARSLPFRKTRAGLQGPLRPSTLPAASLGARWAATRHLPPPAPCPGPLPLSRLVSPSPSYW